MTSVTAQFTPWLGAAAAILTTAAFVPQAWRTWRTRSARDLSMAWLVALTSGVALWFAYGLLIGLWPLILSNGVTLALLMVILAIKLRPGD